MNRRRQRGQSLVEFALVFPIFAILLFGIIDLGRYVYTANALSNGTREGARAASVGVRPTPLCAALSRTACAEAVVRSQSWGIPESVITPVATCLRAPADSTTLTPVLPGQCTTNDILRVQAQTNFTLVTPIIAQFLGALPIATETQVTVQQ